MTVFADTELFPYRLIPECKFLAFFKDEDFVSLD